MVGLLKEHIAAKPYDSSDRQISAGYLQISCELNRIVVYCSRDADDDQALSGPVAHRPSLLVSSHPAPQEEGPMTAPIITISTPSDAPAFLSPMYDPRNVRTAGMGNRVRTPMPSTRCAP